MNHNTTKKWTALLFFSFRNFFLHLWDEQHHTADHTASEWKPYCIGRASELHNFFCPTLFFSYKFLLSFFNFLLWMRVDRKDKGKWAAIYIKVYRITILLFHYIFFAFSCWGQVINITLKSEPHPRTKRTAGVEFSQVSFGTHEINCTSYKGVVSCYKQSEPHRKMNKSTKTGALHAHTLSTASTCPPLLAHTL